MDEEKRRTREAGIHEAAYDQLAVHGYGGASMLRIAKAAKASNETLYRWYGDKDGLFSSMVRENAAGMRAALVGALNQQKDPWAVLEDVAPVFLRMILGERAILLNRAAAADPTGALGAVISAGGRSEIMPLLDQLMQKICIDGVASEASGWFVSLLVGDLQVRRMIHQQGALSDAEIEERCRNALDGLRRLLAHEQRGG